jgi:hypothetical protein
MTNNSTIGVKGSHYRCISRTGDFNYRDIVYAKPVRELSYPRELTHYNIINSKTGETICSIDANTFKNRFEEVRP